MPPARTLVQQQGRRGILLDQRISHSLQGSRCSASEVAPTKSACIAMPQPSRRPKETSSPILGTSLCSDQGSLPFWAMSVFSLADVLTCAFTAIAASKPLETRPPGDAAFSQAAERFSRSAGGTLTELKAAFNSSIAASGVTVSVCAGRASSTSLSACSITNCRACEMLTCTQQSRQLKLTSTLNMHNHEQHQLGCLYHAHQCTRNCLPCQGGSVPGTAAAETRPWEASGSPCA